MKNTPLTKGGLPKTSVTDQHGYVYGPGNLHEKAGLMEGETSPASRARGLAKGKAKVAARAPITNLNSSMRRGLKG